MAKYRITCGDLPDMAEQEYHVGISPTAEPNTQLRVPNTQISKPNTQVSKPKLSTVWSNFLKLFEGLGIDLGGMESVYFAHSEHFPPCSSLHMRGSRSVGPKPPL